jgi:L-lysine 6-transaminase
MGNQITISPKQVDATLKKHILKDGWDLVLDLEKSQGVFIYDSKNERTLLDFFTCFASLPIGYNHPKMINDENFKHNLLLSALTNPSNSDIYTTQYAEFIDTFSRIGIPSYLPHAFFIAGGALAVENALKVAMDWKVQKNFQKGYTKEVGTKVLHFKEAFHGRSGYTMSLTNTDPAKINLFAKFNDWPRVINPKISFPYSDESYEDLLKRENLAIQQIKQAFKSNPDEICAIIIEPIQGEGGDNHFRKEFFEKLRVLADENECMLIYDEVQTGVGLTGKFWCHEHFGENARPDILCFGKKMQVCGILVGKKVDEIETNVFRVPSRINSTWGGNLVDMVRASQILQIIHDDNLVEHVAKTGEYFLQELQAVAQEHKVSNIRGRGFMCAFDLPNADLRNQFLKLGMAKGVLFLGCAEKSIRFRPALIMQKQEIDMAIKVIREVLTELKV